MDNVSQIMDNFSNFAWFLVLQLIPFLVPIIGQSIIPQCGSHRALLFICACRWVMHIYCCVLWVGAEVVCVGLGTATEEPGGLRGLRQSAQPSVPEVGEERLWVHTHGCGWVTPSNLIFSPPVLPAKALTNYAAVNKTFSVEFWPNCTYNLVVSM